MGFKAGLIIGGAVGYVFGAKAGRQRYEQIMKAWSKVKENNRVQQVTAAGKSFVDERTQGIRSTISDGMHEVSDKLRDVAEGNGQAGQT